MKDLAARSQSAPRSNRGERGTWWSRRRFFACVAVIACLLVPASLLARRWEPVHTWFLERASLESLQSQASHSPSDAWVHYFLGRALARRGQHTEAVESFNKALGALAGRDHPALRAQVNGEMARSLVALKQDRLAASYARRALEQDIGNVTAHLANSQILVNRELYEVAIQELQAVTEIEPGNAEAWYALGQVHNLDRHPEKAEVALRKAIELAPDISEHWIELGDSFASRSRFDEAEKCFARALQLRPGDQNAVGKLARARALQARTPEEYRQARKALLSLAEAGSGDAFFYGQIGILDAQFGDLPEAERNLKRAVALNPNYPEALYNLAMTYRRLGRPRESEQMMKRFQRIEQLYRRVVGLRKRLSLRPKDLVLNLELGRALEAQGQLREAAQQFRQLLRLSPGHPEAMASLRRLTQQGDVAPQ